MIFLYGCNYLNKIVSIMTNYETFLPENLQD